MEINFSALLPLIIIAAAPVVIMISIAIKRNHTAVYLLSFLSTAVAFVSLFFTEASGQVTKLLIVDEFALFYIGLIFAASFIVFLLSYNYMKSVKINVEEYYIMIFLALLGSSVLITSRHFISFFLGLELLSVSLYVLIAYLEIKKISLEAGMKYLILAAVSSAFLLFGFALIYASYGSMEFSGIGLAISRIGMTPISLIGFSMLVVGVGFKLAVVPFHMWTPDVYEGAPVPVTAFVATVSKGGVFAVLYRFFNEINGYNYPELLIIISLIAVASMLIGNLLALLQNNVKRILAYSSIAHLGYLLVAFIAGGIYAVEAVTFYLTAYFITTLGAFGIVTIFSNSTSEADSIDDYSGLFWRRPWIAAIFTIMLLSLAGIPLTAGFIGKYYLLVAGVNSSLWTLVIILVLSSVIGLFYYLRIIVAMFKPSEKEFNIEVKYSFNGGFALIVLSILLIWFGIFPSGIISVIKAMVSSIT